MKNKRFNLSIALIIIMMFGISITGYAVTEYTGYKDFLVFSHLVYNPSYSDMFRPTDTGSSKLVIDAASVITGGDLTAGAVICNLDGTVTNAIPFSKTRNIPSTTSPADYTHVFLLSGSATYKAFLKPENGLHLYMNRATIWYD